MIFECADCTFGGVAVVGIRGDKLEDNIVLVEERFALCLWTCCQGCGQWGLQHSGVGVVSCCLGYSDIKGLLVFDKVGVDGVGVVVIEEKYVYTNSWREDRKSSCLVGVCFVGLGVDVNDASKNVVRALFLLEWTSLRKAWWEWMERILFCSWSRWPFTVKGDCGRCLETRLSERPSHDVKCPWLMAMMKVDFTGLKDAA